MKPVLLIVDDEESVRASFRLVLKDDYELAFAADCKQTLQILKNQTFDLCLLDIMLPDGTGIDLLRQIKRKDDSLDVIMVTALQGVDTALEAMKLGAYDYLTKPYRVDELLELVRRVLKKRDLEKENKFLRAEMDKRKPASLIGESRPLLELLEKAKRLALADVPVLLMGEVGTGVEEVARLIHEQSHFQKGAFIKINCAALTPGQAESELFGRERRGSKEGGLQIGKLEFAQGGTLFLEQADRLPPAIQDKLLQVFVWKKVTRVDGETALPANFRVVASVTLDQARKQAEGLKEEFLGFFGEFVLRVPPLAERKRDIPELIQHFLKTSNQKAKVPVKSLTPEAVQFLTEYPWPGNVRELENSVEMMVLFAGKETLTIDDVPLDILIKQIDLAETKKEAKLSLKRARRQFERQYIRKVLEKTRGNQTRTASTLGLHRNTLIWKLRELSLEDDYKRIVQKRRERGLGFRDS